MATTTTSAELSLINDSEFLEQLQNDLESGRPANPASDSRLPSHDLYASLDRGLPMRAGAPEFEEPAYIDRPAETPFEPHDDPAPAPLAPAESMVPAFAAAIVIAACLTAGAATAAYVFQDSLTRITARHSASR